MLFLTRKVNETIIINDDIELTVIEVRGKSVKIGLNFPPTATVYRREVWERIQAEKKERKAGGVADSESKLRERADGGN